jgi:hypothetical protein
MIYGHGSKAINIQELLGHYGDRDFGGDENTDFEAGDGDGGDDSDDNAFLMLLTSLASIPAWRMKMPTLWLKMTIIKLKFQRSPLRFLRTLPSHRWPNFAALARLASFTRSVCYYAKVAS